MGNIERIVYIATALFLVGTYFYGVHKGKEEAYVSAIEHSVQVLRDRQVIRNEISNSDAGELCNYYGLSDAEAIECVRRIRDTYTKP